jgi:hypothetical protein
MHRVHPRSVARRVQDRRPARGRPPRSARNERGSSGRRASSVDVRSRRFGPPRAAAGRLHQRLTLLPAASASPEPIWGCQPASRAGGCRRWGGSSARRVLPAVAGGGVDPPPGESCRRLPAVGWIVRPASRAGGCRRWGGSSARRVVPVVAGGGVDRPPGESRRRLPALGWIARPVILFSNTSPGCIRDQYWEQRVR